LIGSSTISPPSQDVVDSFRHPYDHFEIFQAASSRTTRALIISDPYDKGYDQCSLDPPAISLRLGARGGVARPSAIGDFPQFKQSSV